MQQYKTKRSGSSFRSRGALIATLAIVILGSVGFTAAGGFELIKGWIITVEVEGVGEVAIDDDDVTIETDDNGVTSITIDGAEIDADVEEGATVTITATSTGDGMAVIDNGDGTTKTVKTVVVQPQRTKDTNDDE